MKNCHPSPNWRVTYSTLTNHVASPCLRKINATTTNMPMLPVNKSITIQVALPSKETSPRDNTKLSAQFFVLLPNKATATDRTIDLPTDIRATNLRTRTAPPTIITTTVAALLHLDRTMEIVRPCGQHPQILTTNVDHKTMQIHNDETHL